MTDGRNTVPIARPLVRSAKMLLLCRVAGWYLTGGGRGDMSPSLDFGVPLTGIDSVIPGWDAFNLPHWNEFCPSVSDMNPQQRRPQAQRC